MTNALRVAAIAYGAAVLIHAADHLRRGFDASPGIVIALGSVALVFQAVAVGSALAGKAYAARVAFAVALPNTIGVIAVHLLPRWSGLSDALVGGNPAPGTTTFSWATAIAEVVTGLVLVYVARQVISNVTTSESTLAPSA